MKNDLFNDRISRFSIRKLHVGVCSVLLGTLVMLGTATGVGADEVTEEKQADGVAATTEVDKAETPVTTEAAPTKEVTYKAEAAPAVSTEVKPELNSDKLAAYVAEIEANVANGKYSNKTDESVEVLKVGLANAKNALTSATNQSELDVAYQSLVTTVNAKLKNKEKVVAEEKVATADKTEATTGNLQKTQNQLKVQTQLRIQVKMTLVIVKRLIRILPSVQILQQLLELVQTLKTQLQLQS